MRNRWPCLLATLLGLPPPTFGSTADAQVLAADVAFAARAAEIGHHAAFAEYLAEDAVLFRPEAVRGQEWLATHEPAGGRLEWSPSAVAIDCTGTLAVTTGPWRYANSGGGEPVAGHYLSLWRLDAQSKWRVLLDHGIDHAAAIPASLLQEALARLWPPSNPGQCAGHADAAGLARAEARLNEQVLRLGLPAALQGVARAGALAYRDDAAPGPLSAMQSGTDGAYGPGTVVLSLGTMFATNTDLAVTHGVLQSPDGLQRSVVVRVWSRERRRWQLAIDLRTPLPQS